MERMGVHLVEVAGEVGMRVLRSCWTAWWMMEQQY